MGNTNIIHLANEFILGQTIQSYPLRIETLHELAERLGFYIYTYLEAAEFIVEYDLEEYTKLSAFTFIKRSDGETVKIIFYRNDLPYGEKVFCILHEIGHIYLNHTYYGVLGKSPDEITMSRQEEEADIFAYQVAAPVCLLKAMDISEIDKICVKTLLENNRAEHVFFLLTQYKESDELERQIVHKYALDYLKNPGQVYTPALIGESKTNAVLDGESENLELEGKGLKQTRRQKLTSQIPWFLTIACLAATVGILVFVFIDTDKKSQNVVDDSPEASYDSVWEVPPEEPSVSEESSSPDAGVTGEVVYVSTNGSKYHFPGCQYINVNMVEVSLSEAVRQGYEPCKRCGK